MDLVHLVVGRSTSGGRAFIAYDESVAFGLTASYRKDLAFPHEIGHNMGLHHDRYEVGVPRTGSNYGYVNQRMFEPNAPESAQWRTIMGYPDQCLDVLDYWCTWLPYFSNPEKIYKGDPMGVPTDNPSIGADGPADALGTLNDRREGHRELSPELSLTHTKGASDAVAVLAVREWRGQHGDGHFAQAIEHRHHSSGFGLAV